MIHTLDTILQGIGKNPDTAINTPYTSEAQIVEFLSEEKPILLPKIGTISDEDQVGDRQRFGRKLNTTYWQQMAWTETGRLNDHIAAILMIRHLAGAFTPTVIIPVAGLTPATTNYAVVQNVYNSVPKLSTIYRQLGPEYFIHQMGVNRFMTSQEGESEPRFTADLLGTGFFLDEDQLDGLDFDGDTIEAAPDYEYFHGAGTEFTFTDGVTNYNFPANEGLLSHEIESNNNMVIKALPGDTFRTAGVRTSGAIPKRIAHGKQSGVIRCKIYLGNDLNVWKAMVATKKLTGLKVEYNGYNFINANPAHNFEFEIAAPNCQFGDVTGDRDEVYGALSLEIVPFTDAVTGGRFTGRIKTNKTILG
jgi:hypothetical protein